MTCQTHSWKRKPFVGYPFTSIKRRQGFTLLELLVVILIIGLLTGIVAPRFMGQVSRSESTTARAQMDAFSKALDAFRMDTGHYPSSQQGLAALAQQPQGEPRWHGPYMQGEIPLDPWEMPYQYQSPGPAGHDYLITSYGQDKAPGGAGDDADLVR